jgi:hypothetical protein
MTKVNPPSRTSVNLARLLLRMIDRPGIQLIGFGFQTPETPPDRHGPEFTVILGEDSGLTPIIVQHLKSIVASWR